MRNRLFNALLVVFFVPMLAAAAMVPPETCNYKVTNVGAGNVWACHGTCHQVFGEPEIECTIIIRDIDGTDHKYCTCGDTHLWPNGPQCISEKRQPGGVGPWFAHCPKDDCPEKATKEECDEVTGVFDATPKVPCNCPYTYQEIEQTACDQQGGIWFNGLCWFPE